MADTPSNEKPKRGARAPGRTADGPNRGTRRAPKVTSAPAEAPTPSRGMASASEARSGNYRPPGPGGQGSGIRPNGAFVPEHLRPGTSTPDPRLAADPVGMPRHQDQPRAARVTGTSIPRIPASATPVTGDADLRIPRMPSTASRIRGAAGMEAGTGRAGTNGIRGNTGGNLATLGAMGLAAGIDHVRDNYPRRRAEEEAVALEEGVSPRAFGEGAPVRRGMGTPSLVARRQGMSPPPSANLPGNGAELGPRGSASPSPGADPVADAVDITRARDSRPAPRPAPRPMRDERDNSADSLNRLELARIDRVKRGAEADRPPQFAKGGMVAKKGVNPFAAASKAAKPESSAPLFGKAAKAPSANPFAAPSKVGKAGRPAGPPSAPPVPKAKAPKAPKVPALPFAKGGMPKKPKGC